MRITIPLYKSLQEIATADGITYRGAISRLHKGEYISFLIPRKQTRWKDGEGIQVTKMVRGYIRKSELIKIIYNILSDGTEADNTDTGAETNQEKDTGKEKKTRKKAKA